MRKANPKSILQRGTHWLGVEIPGRGKLRIDRVFEWQMYERKRLPDKWHNITLRSMGGYSQET